MGTTQSGILGGRLPLAEYEANFSDLHPSLDRHGRWSPPTAVISVMTRPA